MEHSTESLDPEDWEAVRSLGHRMVDEMLDYLQDLDERPVWQPAPQKVKAHFNQPLTLERYQFAGRNYPWICTEAIIMEGEAVV